MDIQQQINDMIDKIIDGDNTSARQDFESLVNQKLELAIDARKIDIAQSIYSDNESEPESETEAEEETTDESE